MVDSRAKGATAETKARDELRKLTGLKWERVPGSGALDPKHGLKGDLYVVGEKNLYVTEVKHYKDDHLNSSLLTGKSPQLLEWWSQAVRQGVQVDKTPLLIYKHDRSKMFAAYKDIPSVDYRYMYINVNIFINIIYKYI
jgi:hypothetical protein